MEAAQIAMDYVCDIDKEEFFGNLQCQDAVIRRLEIIGEAARRLSDNSQKEYPDLPLSDMIGMRNIMIHEYDGVDLYLVWETVHADLPQIIDTVDSILQTL